MHSESVSVLSISPIPSYQSISTQIIPSHQHNLSHPINKPSSSIQLIILFYICLISTNNYFCYHEPSAIASEYEIFYHLTTSQFGTLFTIYSLPNIILVFFSGQVIDKYGLQRSSLLFNYTILWGMTIAALTPSIITLTQQLFTHSSQLSLFVYVLLLFSRLLLGLGGESIVACSSAMVAKWYSATPHLNTAMAINQAAVQLFGSSAAFYILPRTNSILLSQWITVLVCLISLFANYQYNSYENLHQSYLSELQLILQAQQNSLFEKTTEEDNYIIEKEIVSNSTHRPNHRYHITEKLWDSIAVLFQFPPLFYILLLHISLVSPILYTFTAFGPLYLQQTFPSTQSATAAGDAISLLYMSIMIAPVSGFVIDCIGYRSYVQLIATCNIPIIFLALTYGLLQPTLAMIWMGIIYSITESNGLALISLIVPQELTGTAFGLLGCCISIALLVEPAAVGYIFEVTGSFKVSIWIFFTLTLIGSVLAFIFILYDLANGNIVSKVNK